VSEPRPEPKEATYLQNEDARLELLEPFEWDGLDFGSWVEQMPTGDGFRMRPNAWPS
jgi:hypothetical protein